MHEINVFEHGDSIEKPKDYEQSNHNNITLYKYDEWITILNDYWIIFDNYLNTRKKNLKDALNINFVIGLKQDVVNSENDINNYQSAKYFIKMELLNESTLIVDGPYIEIDIQNQNVFKYLLIQVINCFLYSVDKNSKINFPLSYTNCIIEYRNSLKFKEFLSKNFNSSDHSYIYYDYRFSLIDINDDNPLRQYIQEMLIKIKTRKINGITDIDDLKFELEQQISDEEKLKVDEDTITQIANEESKYEKVYTIMKTSL